MSLSDTQSLVDLLRLAVRENHSTLTSRFINPVSQEAVNSAVESLWQELCAGETGGEETDPPATETEPSDPEAAGDADADAPVEQPDQQPSETEEIPPEGETPADGDPQEEVPAEPVDPPVVDYPPCPWQIRFYPDPNRAEIVEILLD